MPAAAAPTVPAGVGAPAGVPVAWGAWTELDDFEVKHNKTWWMDEKVLLHVWHLKRSDSDDQQVEPQV